jgi:hypothetical protein
MSEDAHGQRRGQTRRQGVPGHLGTTAQALGTMHRITHCPRHSERSARAADAQSRNPWRPGGEPSTPQAEDSSTRYRSLGMTPARNANRYGHSTGTGVSLATVEPDTPSTRAIVESTPAA